MQKGQVLKPTKKQKDLEKQDRTIGKVLWLSALIAFSLLIIFGVATVAQKATDWGAEHQIVEQSIVASKLRLQLPYRIETRQPREIISPLAEDFVEKAVEDEFTPVEKKIVDRWGYKDGVTAIAIFTCESGLNQYAVSATGDLGIAQINWSTWRNLVESKGRTSADLLEDVDFNLDIAYIVWDRGDGEEGNEEGNWNGWSVFNSGLYLSCY